MNPRSGIPAMVTALNKPSVLLLLFSACFMFWFNDLLKPYNSTKNETNFVWDAAGYYSYLPATFYYHGSFEFNNGYESFLPLSPAGKRYPKYTYGVALIEAPFYGVGFVYAWLTNKSLNGFSSPFADAIRWGSLFYVLTGMLFLRRFLLHFFNEVVTAITLFCCLFGSMLYIYTYMQGEISHGYLFAIFSAFLYLTLKWHQNQKHVYSLGLAALLGLISVVRFTDIYIALVFVFWDVKKLSDIKSKFLFFIKHFKHLLWFPLIGFLFWVPQLLFWKHHLGSYVYDPYVGEHFFWKDPQVFNILFSYRKGWITYTPIVLLAFAGIVFIKRDFPLSRFTFIGIIALCIYIFSCWWDWNYGGCFGNRPFCQLIALLAIPIAFVTNFVLYAKFNPLLKRGAGLALLVVVFSCTFFNMGISYQFQEQRMIHGYNMSKSIYWNVFRQYHYGAEFINPYWSMLDVRDEEAWMKGLERDDRKNKK